MFSRMLFSPIGAMATFDNGVSSTGGTRYWCVINENIAQRFHIFVKIKFEPTYTYDVWFWRWLNFPYMAMIVLVFYLLRN